MAFEWISLLHPPYSDYMQVRYFPMNTGEEEITPLPSPGPYSYSQDYTYPPIDVVLFLSADFQSPLTIRGIRTSCSISGTDINNERVRLRLGSNSEYIYGTTGGELVLPGETVVEWPTDSTILSAQYMTWYILGFGPGSGHSHSLTVNSLEILTTPVALPAFWQGFSLTRETPI